MKVRSRIHSTAYVPQPWDLISTGSTSQGYGVNAHMDQFFNSSHLTGPTADLTLNGWRSSEIVSWTNIEQSANVLTWTHANLTKLEAINDAGAALGCTALLCPLGVNTSAGVSTWHPGEHGWDTSTFTAYKTFVSYAVTHLGSKCNLYEVCNEPDNIPLTTQQHLQHMQNTYSTVKAANANASVFCGVVLDVPGGVDFWSSLLTDSLNGRTWVDDSDGFSWHSYVGQPSGTARTPEIHFSRSRLACDTLLAARPNCRMMITEHGWPDAGVSSVTDATIAQYYSRTMFLMRSLPIERWYTYELFDAGAFKEGLYISAFNNPKTQVSYITKCRAHLATCVGARYYQHQTEDVHAVSLAMADGTYRLALWGHTWKSADGPSDFTGVNATGNTTIWMQTIGAGTLSIEQIPNAATTTSIPSGISSLSIPYTGITTVLSANVPISFLGLSV